LTTGVTRRSIQPPAGRELDDTLLEFIAQVVACELARESGLLPDELNESNL